MLTFRPNTFLAALAMVLGAVLPAAAQVTIPYTFVFETTIDQDQVNSNFTTLGNAALNRAGGTMTGALTSSGGSLTGTWTGGPTMSGAWTFSGANVHSGDSTVTGTLTFDNDALHIFDTDGTHDLIITPGSNLTADRVLTLTTGDAARTLTISGNATISQDYSSTGNPTFAALTVTSCTGCGWGLPRVTSTTSSATPTPNVDTTDLYTLTAQAAAAAFGAPTGTPVNGQKLLVRIKDNGTARALTWNAAYVAGGTSLPTTTVISKILTLGFMYNTDNSLNKWQLLAAQQEQ